MMRPSLPPEHDMADELDTLLMPSLGLRAPGSPYRPDLAPTAAANQPDLDRQVLERTTLAWRLYPKASQWLVALPVESRPILTANRHPSVVNHLALLWDQPAARDAYLNELLHPGRTCRHQFSDDVLDELIQLCAISLGRRITGPALRLAA